MSISSQPNPNGGPRTEAGKAASSQNALTHGLFAAHDVICPGDEPIYAELRQNLHDELAPETTLELNLVAEIHRAMWRLRRCGLVEERLSAHLHPEADPARDPMEYEKSSRLQIAVDRARNQAHRLLHKCTAELRKLQTERQYRNESFDSGTNTSSFGLADYASIESRIAALAAAAARRDHLSDRDALEAFVNAPPPPDREDSSFCKTPSAGPNHPPAPAPAPTPTQLNLLCPCNSGLKFRYCCGRSAVTLPHAA